MPLPVITDGYRCILQFSGAPAGKSWTTHLDYWRNAGTGEQDELFALLDAAMTAWNAAGPTTSTELRDFFDQNIDFLGVDIYKLDGVSAARSYTPTTTAWGTATVGASQLPPDLAVVSTLRTADRGPRARGRCYWFPNAPLSNNSGVPHNDLRTNLSTNMFNNLAILTDASDEFLLSVIGRTSESDPTPVRRIVESIGCDAHFDVQRRRGQA